MTFLERLMRPPWRTLLLLLAILGLFGLTYLVWSPGDKVTDGRHDRGTNGMWLQHGWLGHDDWFNRYQKDRTKFRDPKRLAELSEFLREQHITHVFPHLCPCNPDGTIAKVDDAQVERFLDATKGISVTPWVGGVFQSNTNPASPKWRARFIASIVDLLQRHPRLAGVQINIEPMPTGNADFLVLLKELRTAIPGKTLSVAAYPPPTRWHPFPDVHWDETYFRRIAAECDLMAVMMYDTSIRVPKLYESVMADWTVQALEWSRDTDVLLGIPTYADEGVGYHDPRSENITHALRGIHAGLNQAGLPPNYLGVAIYCGWETDEEEWQVFEKEFRKP